jgi:uncharacterized protein (DUF983 family)
MFGQGLIRASHAPMMHRTNTAGRTGAAPAFMPVPHFSEEHSIMPTEPALRATETWQPDRSAPGALRQPPSLWTAVRRGAVNRCPVCGVGRVFNGYLTLAPACTNCAAPIGQLRADDAPPYIVIFLTGHLLVPPVLWVERVFQPPMWLHMVVWLPLFTLVCLALLRPVKGAVVGWMLRLGFLGPDYAGEPVPAVQSGRLPDA